MSGTKLQSSRLNSTYGFIVSHSNFNFGQDTIGYNTASNNTLFKVLIVKPNSRVEVRIHYFDIGSGDYLNLTFISDNQTTQSVYICGGYISALPYTVNFHSGGSREGLLVFSTNLTSRSNNSTGFLLEYKGRFQRCKMQHVSHKLVWTLLFWIWCKRSELYPLHWWSRRLKSPTLLKKQVLFNREWVL